MQTTLKTHPGTTGAAIDRNALGLVTPTELANMLDVSTGTLANWRAQSRGPAYRSFGVTRGRVMYHLDDVQEWLVGTRVSTTESS